MENNTVKRDYGFDNIKFILIVFVVLGHVLEEISTTGALGVIRSVIYSFHMPLFVFISGYFSKRSTRKTQRAFVEYLIPFFLFNTLYFIVSQGTLRVNIFLPVYAFWYLLSLFFWNISIDYIYKFKPLIIVSFLLGIYIGFFDDIDELFALSRTIGFFPFFILGYLCNKEKIYKWRNINKALPVSCIIACTFMTAFANYKGHIPVVMYELLKSYHNTNLGALPGCIMRALVYLVGIIMIVCIISLVPNKEYPFTKLGTRTIVIYIFSSYFIKAVFEVINVSGFNSVFSNIFIDLLFSLALTAIIVFLTGNKWVSSIYKAFISSLRKMLMRP